MIDHDKMNDLKLWATNVGELHSRYFLPASKQLYQKYVNGEFERDLALRPFLNAIPETIKVINTLVNDQKFFLTKDEKTFLAELLLDWYTMDFDLHPDGGYYDIYPSKKKQPDQPMSLFPDYEPEALERLIARAERRQHGDIHFTPPELAAELVARADIGPGSRVLEPSAGIARLADAIRNVTPFVDCCEVEDDFRHILTLKGYPLVSRDFLQLKDCVYDAIIMNPPFSDEVRHVEHALDLLRPGGVMVTLISQQLITSEYKKHERFREWLTAYRPKIEKTEADFSSTKYPPLLMVLKNVSMGISA